MTNVRREKPDKNPAQLRAGDLMNSEEFHRLYEQMPADFKAELIGGVVYEPSPVSYSHAHSHALLVRILGAYVDETPGAEVTDNASLILSERDEVQPDVILRLRPEFGGSSDLTANGYIKGPPELLVEIAVTSRMVDLTTKRKRYQMVGVPEYLVVCPETKELHWFDLRKDTEYSANEAGVLKSVIFPGLWLSRKSLIDNPDFKSALILLKQGMAIEHTAFVETLLNKERENS